MIFEIEIIGKKLLVKTNTQANPLVEENEFDIFSKLLEQDEVFIGITASMNQNKKITIDNFSLAEISVMEKGIFSLENSIYKAGETISLYFSIKSTCGVLLKIYPNEYTPNNENNSTNLSLIINNDVENPSKIIYNFSEVNTNLKLDITRTKTGTYTALIKFNDNLSSPVKFTIIAGEEVERFEICNQNDNIINDGKINSNLEQTKDSFTVPICSYDQYNNTRNFDSAGAKDLFSILYPYYFPSDNALDFKIYKEEVDYEIPFSTFGQYQIFNQNFKQNTIRYYNLGVNRISPEKSDAVLLDGKHLYKKGNDKNVTLRLKLRDEFGRDIPNRIITEMKCDFSGSYIENNNKNIFNELSSSVIEEEFLDNDIIHLIYNIEDLNEGKYIFIPKIQCEGDEYDLTLKCSETEDDETSLFDKCAFHITNGNNDLNNKKIRLYSNFLNDYIYFDNSNKDKNQDLLISLDEKNNKKLTEINLLDESDIPMIDPNSLSSISCTLNGDDILKTINIGYSIAIYFNENKSLNSFDNTQIHTLTININGNIDFSIGVKFVSVDKMLNNMYNYGDYNSKTIAFYQQESYTIVASENILLFEVFRLNTNTNYLIKESVKSKTDLNMEIEFKGKIYKEGFNYIEKEYSMLISTNLLTKEGIYKIALKDGDEYIIQNLEIKVIPSGEVDKIIDENNPKQDEDYNLIYINEDNIFFFLYDKYDNKIKDNDAIIAFSKLELLQNGLRAQMNMDGKLFIYNEDSSSNYKSITIVLPSGKTYEIIRNNKESAQELNPHKLYGNSTFNSEESSLTVNLFLFDNNGNNITSESLSDSDINNFDVYIIEKLGTNKKFISLKNNYQKFNNNTLIFNTKIYTAGEYEVKLFYNNIHLSCKACHFSVSATKIIDYSKTRMYILGNKRKIPVFSESSQFLLTTKAFIFYLQFYDKYYNEIAVNTQYSLTLYNKEKKNDVNVKLCNYGNSKQEGRQFYHVCSDQLSKFQGLNEGEYYIEVNTKSFSFYVSKTEIESNDKVPVKAIYHQYENETYGTTDSVISLIVDLRNKNNMRIDISQIINDIGIKIIKENSIVNENDYNFDKILGPDDGLMTFILNIKKIGEYFMNITYNGNIIDSREIKIYISCGNIIKLQPLEDTPKYYKGIGTYAYFKVLDINDQICDQTSNNTWNIFNNEDYTQNLITSKNRNEEVYYSITKYYNHMTGVLSVIVNNEINEDITLSSDLFAFEYEINQEELSKEKKNKEYLYATLEENNIIKVSMLKKNYKPYENKFFSLENNETLTLSIFKYVNDETILVNEYNYNEEENMFKFKDEDVSSPGDYFFVVYFNGEVISCNNCQKKVEDNADLISLQNTKVYLKNGYNKYFEIKEDVTNYIYKTSFPFFKINFQTSNNNLVKLTQNQIEDKYNILIKYDGGELGTTIKVNDYNGNVYIYLKDDERENYLNLFKEKRYINLSLEDKKNTEDIKTYNFLLFNDYSSNTVNYEKCNLGPQPIIVDMQSTYILRADEQKEIEVYLDGCTERIALFDVNNFEVEISDDSIDYKEIKVSAIPADTYGNYILLINYEKTIIEPVTAYIKYLNSTSENFKISVIPGYQINSIEFSEDDELKEPNTNYKYAYILMELKDSKDNIITNFGRNLFFNDLNILKITDSNNYNLPYKLSFDDFKNKFRIEIPISGNGKVTIEELKNNNNTKDIKIKESQFYNNINFNMKNDDRKFTFTLNFLDDFYKKIDTPEFSKDDLSFIYITENYATQEIYSMQISPNEFEYKTNEVNLVLSDTVPIYNSYSFVPVVGGFIQICQNCLKKNTFNNYIHSIHNNLYYPHVLNRNIYLQKKYEYPMYIYFTNIDMDISVKSDITPINSKRNINEDYNYYIIGSKSKDKSNIEITFKRNNDGTTKNLIINYIEGDSETYTKEMNIKMEKYYYNYISFISGNYGKLLGLYFYIDIRNSDTLKPLYIPNEYSSSLLSGDSENKTLIEYLNVFRTEIDGTYLVIVPNNKIINGKYTINFSGKNKVTEDNNLNTIAFNSLGAFPKLILLNNKEVIYNNMIKYDLIGQNDNSELICDERLNIYIEPKSATKFIKGDIINNDYLNDLSMNSCKLYIKFIGDIKIITNIGDGFLSELTNSDNSIYNINPHYSKLDINPNIIYEKNETSELKVLFNERSSDDLSFSSDEMPANKGLKSIRYITSTKYILTQTINGLFSSQYIFSPSQFKINTLGTYLFISSISYNNFEKPVFVSYIRKQEKKANHFSVNYFEDNLWTNIDNLLTSNYGTASEQLSFKYPFKLSLNVLDEYDSLYKVENNKISASIFSPDNNKVKYDFNLEVKQINDYDFIIESNKENIDNMIHMETKNSNNKFFIKLIFEDITSYILLDSKNENNLHPRVARRGYGLPGLSINYQYSLINEYENENSYYIIPDEVNSETYCFISKETGLIYNDNIDPNLISYELDGITYENNGIINSYRGCIKIGDINKNGGNLKIKYNNEIIEDEITIIPLKSSIINCTLKSEHYSEIDYDNQSFGYNFGMYYNNDPTDTINNINSKYFSVYLDGQKLKKSEYTFSLIGSDYSIKSDLFLSTTVREKNIYVIYSRGKLDNEVNIGKVKLSIKQKEYSYSTIDFKYYAQVPVHFKAGDVPYFYLIIKDINSACFYGSNSDLTKITAKVSTSISESVTFKIDENSSVKLDDVPTCEYIYNFTTESIIKKSGTYNIEIIEGSNRITSDNFQVQIYIAPGEFYSKNSLLSGKSNIYAGETFTLIFTTKDFYENQPNYYDIVEHFEIKLWNIESEEKINDDSIKYQKIKVSEDNDYIEITMIVTESNIYNVKAYYNDKEIELKSIFKITINHRECSFYNPTLNLTKIDYKDNIFYSGEEVEINIYCSDQYGNLIKSYGSENFKAIINNNGNLISYEHKFDEIHKIYFTTENEGNYTIQVMLNGKDYSGPLEIKVENFNENLFMCMNKKQVDDLKECLKENNYRELIIGIEGEENICNEESEYQKGNVFMCKINNASQCVFNTNSCDCDENFVKINGYCYPKDSNPINLLNKTKANCLSILEGQGITTAKQCLDGSCRLDEEDCNTVFECPLGFKSCGNICILLNQKCELSKNIEIKCEENEVLCWDYTCSSSYSLCPTRKTCPYGKVLCPDGTCQNSGHCPQPISRNCPNDKPYQCPDFTCVTDRQDCNKNKVCPIGKSLCEDDICSDKCEIIDNEKYKCSNGEYVNNSQLCPSEMKCPSTWIKCPQGGCSQSQENCKFIQGYKKFVCPKNKPILCPDFECVSTFSSCKKNYPICPPHKPYQCWNNECRKSFNECPTEIQCPSNSPLLCSNGLCVNSINDCQEKKMESCGLNKIRCFDGTCASSIELCPTHSYCGKDIIKCWNGACVDSVTKCLSTDSLPICSDDFPYRCPDGTCRQNQISCSTISVCPNSLPVKCFDNSCRATIDECPEYHSCGINKISCPDGTCAKNYDECNTIVTCERDKPFLCYDGSCRAQLDECPKPPSCGNKNVQCPNGSCSSSRQYCKLFSACEAKTPIRCEMNICTDNLDNCNLIRECPIGYVKCSNGDCKIMSSLCEDSSCPSNLPYKCPEGVCVHDEKYCDAENGCPYNAQLKCEDGTCVENLNLCEYINSTDLCPDGSRKSKQNNICPLSNGCPQNKKLKCADGTCIDPEISECPQVYCPRETPIKCLNGLCVKKSGDCHSLPDNDELLNDGQIMCIDGRKVPSYDYCRPIFKCPTGYIKCLDNSCRQNEAFCPQFVKCPKERPFRTNYLDICSKYNDTMAPYIYCPKNKTRCESTGECIDDEIYDKDKCSIPLTKIGCPNENQTRCYNGRCMDSELHCLLASKACPDDNNPFLCKNGKCVSSLNDCEDKDKCDSGTIRCYNGRCVEDNEESYLEKCTNEIGCPLSNPYRCANGECASSQRKCKIISGNYKFILNTICDSSKPYLCSDYSCQSDYSFCKITKACPEGQYKCFNGYCVEKEEDCNKFNNYCPQSNPIRCPSGSCTTNILKCPESFPQESCKEGEFYCVRLGKCVTKKSECIFNYKKNNLKNKEFLLVGESEVLCYDGTIASSGEKCPIVQSCKVGQYRCENGACVYNKDSCINDDEYKCENGEEKCPDGLCHKNCSEVAYQGCLVGQYLCSNGMCVESEIACAGYSMCEDPSVPYRCMDGECKSDITLCPEVQRLSNVKNISYSFNKDNKIEFDFAFDQKGRAIGKLIIPSKGIQLTNQYSIINIEEVATSLVLNSALYNNTPEFLYNVSNGIEGSEGILNHENSIMSPLFKFFSEELSDIKFEIPALLILEHNSYTSSSLYYYDYCLAKLSDFDMKNDKVNENSKWECIQRLEKSDQNEFKLNEFGVYAIILNPSRDQINYLNGDTKNFIFENLKIILIVILVIFILGFIISYVFSRVMRYRGKYHENKAKIESLKQQKEEYKQMQTDVFGQSLGDNLIGIVYAKNPGFNEDDEDLKNEGGLENEIEDLERKCRNVELQNEKLQENLSKLEEEYKQVSNEIELIKNK